MVVPDNLNGIRHLRLAVTVVKNKTARSPRILQPDAALQMTVVIAGERDQFAKNRETLQKPGHLGCTRAIVDEITDDDEMTRPVVRD